VIAAFLIATGYDTMRIKIKMWFTILAANRLKRIRSIFHTLFGRHNQDASQCRRKETDSVVLTMVETLNHGGANHLPLSQINLFGAGSKMINFLLRRKNIPTLEDLIFLEEELDIFFTIYQVCIDALGLDASDLIVRKNVEENGVSQYVKDGMTSHYNAVI
jgi:peroxiredoxin family protein